VLCLYPVGDKSSLNKRSSTSKGLGGDRVCSRVLQATVTAAASGDEGDVWALLLQQMEELQEENLDLVNQELHSIANIAPDAWSPKKRVRHQLGNSIRPQRKWRTRTRIRIESLSNSQVKLETGFRSITSMLSFVAVLVNGSLDLMTESRKDDLSWLQFWYIYFEIIWSKSAKRWRDLALKYSISDPTLREVFDAGLLIVNSARLSWPMVAYYEEDKTLRNEATWSAYEDKRVIFWDTSNLPISASKNAEEQSLTWNSYYHMNCAKIGVGVQPCGWIVVCPEPWMGSASDTMFHSKHEQILPAMQAFQNEDIVRSKDGGRDTVVSWLHGLDRRYWVNQACYNAGEQIVEQPYFSPRDGKFSTHAALFSSTFASDRSGNERAVRMVKHSDYLTKGLQSTGDADRFCNALEAWGFQINFMLAPVH
jgi:hypothetical protein